MLRDIPRNCDCLAETVDELGRVGVDKVEELLWCDHYKGSVVVEEVGKEKAVPPAHMLHYHTAPLMACTIDERNRRKLSSPFRGTQTRKERDA